MEWLQKLLFLIVGAINFAPISAIRSAQVLNRLYGIDVSDTNLVILLQHRALMFGLIGGLILAAAFYSSLRPAAIVAGFISMIGFIVIAKNQGPYNDAIGRIITIDLVAIVLLAIATGVYCLRRYQV